LSKNTIKGPPVDWGGEEVPWGWYDSVAASSVVGDKKRGGVTIPSVLCHCSVRGETGAWGVHRALCNM